MRASEGEGVACRFNEKVGNKHLRIQPVYQILWLCTIQDSSHHSYVEEAMTGVFSIEILQHLLYGI